MNEVERIARELCRQYAKGMDESGDRTDIFNAWVPSAKDLLTELQAPQRELIEKWRQETEEFRGTGNKFYLNKDEMNGAYCYSEADKLEARIKELEQAMGSSDDR